MSALQSALRILTRPCSSSFASLLLRRSANASRRPFASVGESQHNEQERKPQLLAPRGFVSESTDPWFNLSYEDWLLRNTPHDEPTLFVYRNKPCVVIGRNQNPWKESTPQWLREQDIPLIRRRSGGGTVFHDLGNVNFSIMLPRLLFTRNQGAELVAKAVRDRLGISSCTVNDRNDVIIRTTERDLKVSGSAYKIIQHRAYHHGTMLISSDLSNLGQALRSNSPQMETKGIPSFRSPVTTLNSHLSSGQHPITPEDFITAVTQEFSAVYTGSEESMVVQQVSEDQMNEPNVLRGVEELKSWDWTYGQTPEFTNLIESHIGDNQLTAKIASRKALITDIALTWSEATGSADRVLRQVEERLLGAHYESLLIDSDWSSLESSNDRQLAEQILASLREAM
ncbi:hypothetical protein BD324DRAFT_614915 [Kockovaella imperatae]|uniref:Putative lipoate-protein ligase A n=1 Tax=Kockovaella imperatae TaxID=4999 RepID=A0A1Y1UNZ4_9TREE|nr:hypothetical protein BD324DRAFT_614915 [Kockovaella imperatae]ORX39768.1 hypothetical protein BD324DRAFT_614915 [Kockovaella imperatae]